MQAQRHALLSLVASSVLLSLGASIGRAQAQEQAKEPVSAECSWPFGFEERSVGEAERLSKRCEEKRAAPKPDAPKPDAPPLNVSGWAAVALAPMLPAKTAKATGLELLLWPPEPPKGQKAETSACKSFGDLLVKFALAARGTTVEQPLPAPEEPCRQALLKALVKDETTSTSSALALVVAGADDVVELVVNDEVIRVDAPLKRAQLGYFIAAVPDHASVTLIARPRPPAEAAVEAAAKAQTTPLVLPRQVVRYVDGYVDFWAASPPLCLDLKVATKGGEPIALWLGGVMLDATVARRQVWLSTDGRTDHELTVVHLVDKRPYARLPIDMKALSGGRCTQHSLDLKTTGKTTLLPIVVNELCNEAGVHVPGLYEVMKQTWATRADARSDSTFLDYYAWQQMYSRLGMLGELEQKGGNALNASTGQLSTSAALRDTGAELLRQGFSTAYWGELTCALRHPGPGFTYSFVLRRIELDGIRTGTRDEEWLGKVMKVQPGRTVQSVSELRDLVLEPLATLEGKRHVSILPGVGTQWDFEPTKLTLYSVLPERKQPQDPKRDVEQPKRDVEARWKPLSDDEASRVCSDLDDWQSGRSPKFTAKPDKDSSRWVTAPLRPGLSIHNRDVLLERDEEHQEVLAACLEAGDRSLCDRLGALRAPRQQRSALRPGRYLVTVDDAGTQNHRCLTIEAPRPGFWLDGALGVQLMDFNERALNGQTTRLQLTLGTWILAPIEPLRVGLASGYSLSWRDADSPPSDDDVEALGAPDRDGEYEIAWRRHAVPFGIVFNWAFSRANQRLTLWAAATPQAELAILDITDVQSALSTFRRAGKSIDFDFNVRLQLGLTYRTQENYAYRMFVTGAWVDIDDTFAKTRNQIDYDSGFDLEIGMGVQL